MILYYSATGNTKFAAKLLAKLLNDESIDLLERIRTEDYTPISSEKPFIICSPVYVCEPPRFLCKFLKQLKLKGNPNVYFVFTSGGYAGISSKIARRLVRRKGMNYMGRAELRMPRNYIANTLYDMLPPEESRQRILESGRQIPRIAHQIKMGRPLKGRHIFLFESAVTYPFTPVWTRLTHTSKPFYTTDACIGCGKCARLCPLNNIEMKDQKPQWKKPCAHCMACIANCPFEAIEYGNRTQGKERYLISKYVKKKFQ